MWQEIKGLSYVQLYSACINTAVVDLFYYKLDYYLILNSINQKSYSTQSVLTKQCHNKADTGKLNVSAVANSNISSAPM